jgi:uncharacterized protein
MSVAIAYSVCKVGSTPGITRVSYSARLILTYGDRAYRIRSLMTGSLPLRINPFRLAEEGTCLEGTLPMAHMSRLSEASASREGEAKVRLNFMQDERGLDMVMGEVRALLEMQCQRCLEPVAKTIDWRFRLVIAHSDAEALRLQAEHGILEVQDETVLTRDLIEDELLLSLPLASMHDDPQMCDTAIFEMLSEARAEISNDKQRTARSPFAMLKDIQKPDKG